MPVICSGKCGRRAVMKVIVNLFKHQIIKVVKSSYWCHVYMRRDYILGKEWSNENKNILPFQRPKTGHALCKECFFHCFESEIHNTITQNFLFNRGDVVAIAASGGKDSTVLGYVMKLLNERFDYGLNLVLLSIDEGIPGKNIMVPFVNDVKLLGEVGWKNVLRNLIQYWPFLHDEGGGCDENSSVTSFLNGPLLSSRQWQVTKPFTFFCNSLQATEMTAWKRLNKIATTTKWNWKFCRIRNCTVGRWRKL